MTKELNSTQKDELIEQFVELQVDNLDTKTMVAWITDLLTEDYSKLTDSELKETINYYDEDEGLYEELVEIALLPDPKLLIKEDNPNY